MQNKLHAEQNIHPPHVADHLTPPPDMITIENDDAYPVASLAPKILNPIEPTTMTAEVHSLPCPAVSPPLCNPTQKMLISSIFG
jgi:hypothetical protein